MTRGPGDGARMGASARGGGPAPGAELRTARRALGAALGKRLPAAPAPCSVLETLPFGALEGSCFVTCWTLCMPGREQSEGCPPFSAAWVGASAFPVR